jgi:hypothetical protein
LSIHARHKYFLYGGVFLCTALNAMARPRHVLTMREDTIMMYSFDDSIFGLPHPRTPPLLQGREALQKPQPQPQPHDVAGGARTVEPRQAN